ncbi:MAG: thiamine diphosphokinase [Anaerolineaceae bacterium]
MSGKRAIVFANGELKHPEWALEQIRASDLLVAADGGLNHLLKLGLIPQYLVGDLDSVTPQQVDEMRAKGCKVEQFPVDKDQTDLELALLRAIVEEPEMVLVFGALGGRIDQELANLSLLLMPELIDTNVRILSESEQIFLIISAKEIQGEPGDRISLLPWGGPAVGVSTQGLKYPLEFETLTPDRSRGVSNVMLEETAQVSVESGSLLCIFSPQGKHSEK